MWLEIHSSETLLIVRHISLSRVLGAKWGYEATAGAVYPIQGMGVPVANACTILRANTYWDWSTTTLGPENLGTLGTRAGAEIKSLSQSQGQWLMSPKLKGNGQSQSRV